VILVQPGRTARPAGGVATMCGRASNLASGVRGCALGTCRVPPLIPVSGVKAMFN